MSGISAAPALDKPVRRRRNTRSEQSERKLLDAAVAELAERSYADLTVRSVAARAAVSPTTAYTYFPSKDKLIAEIYLRLLRDAPAHVDVNQTAEVRVKAQLRDLVLLVADSPRLADACTTAVMADDPVVREVQAKIAGEVGRRIASSLGPGYAPELGETIHMIFSGAMMHARSTPGGYYAVADKVDLALTLVLQSAAQWDQPGTGLGGTADGRDRQRSGPPV